MRSTRLDLIDAALKRVGNTTATLKDAARTRLNRILQDLHQQWDWPFLWLTATLTIQPNGLLVLPADFQKPEDTESLQIFQTGGVAQAAVVHEVDHRTFAMQAANQAMVQATLPKIWTIDYASLTGRVWPLPNDSCLATLRYKTFPSDMPLTDSTAYDNDVPAFPYDNLLTDLLFEWAQSYEVDPRRADQLSLNESLVQKVRGSAFPERSYPSQIPLDPLVFSRPAWGTKV